jgi:hypothetical protein
MGDAVCDGLRQLAPESRSAPSSNSGRMRIGMIHAVSQITWQKYCSAEISAVSPNCAGPTCCLAGVLGAKTGHKIALWDSPPICQAAIRDRQEVVTHGPATLDMRGYC